MRKWTVINQHDGNDTFEAEGDNYGEAACDALQQLGWAISILESDDDTPSASDQARANSPSPEAGCSVIEMGLCEVEHVMLHPNQLYRFVVMPDCDKCKSLDVYSPKEMP